MRRGFARRASFAARALAAIAGLAAAAAAGPPDPERALYEHAVALGERDDDGFARLALEELDRYDRLYPDGRYRDDVHFRMARLERAIGRSEAAAARLLQVLLVDRGAPREEAARAELEALLAGERRLGEREPRFRKALERADAERPGSRLGFLRALALLDLERAADVFEREAERFLEREPLSPAAPEIARLLAESCRRRGDARRAVAAFERCAGLDPDGAEAAGALLASGEVLARDLGRHREAAERFERVAREHASSGAAATAWLRKGEVERQGLKRPEIAVRDFDEVLRRYPDHPDALPAALARAEVLADDLDDPAAADRGLLEAAERWESHARAPELLERAARIEERQLREPVRAAGTLERLAGRYPGFERAAAALLRAASLNEQAGDRRRALDLYRAVAERFPAGGEARRARKRAERLARELETAAGGAAR